MSNLRQNVVRTIGCLGLGVSLLLSVSCTRKTEADGKVSLSVPAKMTSMKTDVSGMETTVLSHVVINISGDGMATIVFHWDAHGGKGTLESPPAAFSLDGVPQGNRLVQVLAVYEGTSGGGMEFYYGDSATSISSSDVAVNIALAPVMTTSSAEASISGRYMNGNNSGETGMIEIKYAKPGINPMLIMSAPIIEGWFSLMALDNVPFEYWLNGKKMFRDGPMTLADFTGQVTSSSQNLFEVNVPGHWESMGWGNTSRRQTGAEKSIFGYWVDYVAVPDKTTADSLLSGKKICYSTTSVPTYYYKYNYDPLASSSLNNATVSYNPAGTVGTDVTVRGGVAGLSNCSSGTNYVNFFKFDVTADSSGSASIPRELAPPFVRGSTNGGSGAAFVVTASGSTYTGTVSFTVIPGISSISSMKVYRASRAFIESNRMQGPGDAFMCGRFEKAVNGEITLDSGQSVTSLGVKSVATGLNQMTVSLPDNNFNDYGYVLCPFRTDSTPWFGTQLYPNVGAASVSSSAPTKLALLSTPVLGQGACATLKVSLQDASSNLAMAASMTTVNLTSSGGVFYPGGSGCSGPITSVNIPTGSSGVDIQFVPSGSAGGTVSISAAATGLTSANIASLSIVSPGTPVDLMIATGQGQMNQGSCIATSVKAVDGAMNVTAVSGTVNLSGAGTYIAAYSDGACASPATTVTMTSGFSNFYTKGVAQGNGTLTATFNYGGHIYQKDLYMAVVPPGVVTKIAFATPASDYLYQNQCAPLAMSFQMDNGTVASIPSAQYLKLFSGVSGTYFYSDSNCTTVLGAAGVPVAASSTTAMAYFKSPASGTAHLEASIINTGINLMGAIDLTFSPLYLQVAYSGGGNQNYIFNGACTVLSFQLTNNPTAGGGTAIPNYSGAPISLNMNVSGISTSNGSVFPNSTCTGGVSVSAPLTFAAGSSTVLLSAKSSLSAGTAMLGTPTYSLPAIYTLGSSTSAMPLYFCPPTGGGGLCPP